MEILIYTNNAFLNVKMCLRCTRVKIWNISDLMFQVNISDYSGDQWITCFQDSAEAILNIKTEELGKLRDEVRSRADGDILT